MPERSLDAVKNSAETEIQGAGSRDTLAELRVKYLGRKGVIAQLTGSIPSLPAAERPVFGHQINALKVRVADLLAEKEKTFGPDSGAPAGRPALDIGLPGIAQGLGSLHPITQVIEEICAIFVGMGFCVVEGPEVETEYNNFTGLNIPLEHPSRDAFDTFYVRSGAGDPGGTRAGERLLLRSHTSPVQVRVMKTRKPPLAVVVPGRVYRPDATDASHSFMFHQIEGLVVGPDIKFSDLKGSLEYFAKRVFGSDIKMRFRPHFFPFTEPSAEVDISCIICKGKGCSVCGRKGWLEVLGSGMVHPNVFKAVGYDTKKFTGFAFGLGVERIAMLKHGINDIRLFFENDLRFLKQF